MGLSRFETSSRAIVCALQATASINQVSARRVVQQGGLRSWSLRIKCERILEANYPRRLSRFAIARVIPSPTARL